MFSRMTRRRRARHAARTTSSPSRPVSQGSVFGPLPAGTMRQRPVVDFTDPAPLAALRYHTASDGHTVVMRTVTLTAPAVVDTPAMARAMADTVTLPAAAEAVPPSLWYGRDIDTDWPDASVAERPALLPPESGLPGAAPPFGFSCVMARALTGTGEAWFRPCADNGSKYADSLEAFWTARGGYAARAAKRADEVRAASRDAAIADFHRRSELALNGPAPRRTGVAKADTTIFATVSAAEFATTGGAR